MLAALGFRSGLRREEARLLRLGDVCLEGHQNELLIRPTEDHTLKSDSARRRVPVGLIFQKSELQLLESWYRSRVRRPTKADKGYLFACKSPRFDVIPRSIFRGLNHIIAGVTRTQRAAHSTHFHHLRHAFCCYSLLRLLQPRDAKIPHLNKTDSVWLRSGDEFRPELMRRTEHHSRSDVFLMGQLLGHLHPSTTMRYFHFCGELLKVYLDRSLLMKPNPDLVRRASGTSDAGKTATEVVLELLEARVNQSRRARSQWAGWSRYREKPNISVEKLMRAWDLLRVLEDPKANVYEVSDAANFIGYSMDEAQSIVRNADYLRLKSSRNGKPRHRFMMFNPDSKKPNSRERSLVPTGSNAPDDVAVIAKFAPMLEQMFSSKDTQATLMRGLTSYVECVPYSVSYPVFRNPRHDISHARDFQSLLCHLDFSQKDICYIPFGGKKHFEEWRSELRLLGKKVWIEERRPPFGNSEDRNLAIGIEPSFNRASSLSAGVGLFGFRFLMVMSYILFNR
jgi:hypothetical protein